MSNTENIEETQLKAKVEQLENQLKPLKARLQVIYQERVDRTNKRLQDAKQAKGKFTLDELVFSATSRCICGAGLAYPKDIGIHGEWGCSAILLGEAKTIKEGGVPHDSSKPFVFYDIRSENQAYIKGDTTRPKKEESKNSESNS